MYFQREIAMTHPERTSANKSGAIINIGSYACFQSFPVISTYAAAKGALAQLTRTLAVEGIEQRHPRERGRLRRCCDQYPQQFSRRRPGFPRRARKIAPI